MQQRLAQPSFLILLVIVTLLFGWIMQPFFGALMWAAVIAIVFHPVQRRLAPRFGQRKNLLALTILLLSTLMVILPLLFLTFSLVQEGRGLYERVHSGEVDPNIYIDKAKSSIPALHRLLQPLGVNLDSLQAYLTTAIKEAGSYMTTQALTFGENAAQFCISFILMLYLAFFFMRDGESLIELLIRALPLGDQRERLLLHKITEVTAATIKGNMVVAAVQGALGGFIFWVFDVQAALLWGVVMAFASLLPSVGSALVWGPVAIYFLISGAVWQGAVLIAFGAGVIGLVDNILRPILVGRSTQMPDYLVLLSTLGGIAVFGLNGFVLGPLIAGVFIVFWEIFIREFNP
ncbi:MAG: AI-2E family transporter [Spongiibacteraceae bacterium]